jgi:crotonobetainyl-CoA:carnitine CoA-transferase CaiB-like acyl-CoA transferase
MPLSAHPSIVPFQLFAAADGHLAVACPKEKFWRLLCVALDRSDLLDDPRCDGFHGRDANRDFVLGELGAAFRTASCAEWVARLEAAGVPAAAVNDVPGALADPQAQARGALVDYEHPRFGTVRQVASPLRHDAAPPPIARGPRRGEHQQSVLADVCGYGPARMAALHASGAFG